MCNLGVFSVLFGWLWLFEFLANFLTFFRTFWYNKFYSSEFIYVVYKERIKFFILFKFVG